MPPAPALTGDERAPLRGDVYRLAQAAFTLSGAVRVPADRGALFVGGRDSPANRQRS